jgi:hypothetical protein
MPSPQILVSFREGLKVLQQADDFTTLRQTIDTLVSICPPEESSLAKDAIARVIRLKQANEAIKFQAYPQALEEVDKKYRDLYIVLRTSKSKAPQPRPTPRPGNSPGSSASPPPQTQMAKTTAPFGGLSLPSLIQWLGNKKKYLLTGGALASTVGGAYWLYKHFNGDAEEKDKKENPVKESSLDKTIRSIQKYKAFTQMVNDPNFSGDYADLVSGKSSKKRKTTKKKKEEPQKSREWDRDEKSLMCDMDSAFNSLSARPQLTYKLPQLPAPKNIDPRDIVDDSEPLSLKPLKTPAKKKIKRARKKKPRIEAEESSSSSLFPTAAPVEKPKKTRRPRKARSSEPKESKAKKVKKIDAPGRLIPIVKRTKRVKKVNS